MMGARGAGYAGRVEGGRDHLERGTRAGFVWRSRGTTAIGERGGADVWDRERGRRGCRCGGRVHGCQAGGSGITVRPVKEIE
jgi:hypothetical protein